jgi:hypothetical protein
MSLIKILQKTITGKKTPLIFVEDGNSSEANLSDSWDSLTNHGQLVPQSIKFDRANLYNAVRAYLDEQGVSYKAQGKVSNDVLLRLDEDKDIRTLITFLSDVKKYDELENRVHSGDEQKELEEFRARLNRYASKYR